MRKVFKYVVPVDDKSHIVHLPSGAQVVHVDYQMVLDEVCFWAEVDPDKVEHPHTFRVVGTGHALPGMSSPYPGVPPQPDDSMWHYVGTAVIRPMGLVWHLYHLGAL